MLAVAVGRLLLQSNTQVVIPAETAQATDTCGRCQKWLTGMNSQDAYARVRREKRIELSIASGSGGCTPGNLTM